MSKKKPKLVKSAGRQKKCSECRNKCYFGSTVLYKRYTIKAHRERCR